MRAPARGQKLDRLANRDLARVVGPERKEMTVVAHEMGGAAIDGAEEEHHVVCVHWVVAEVEEDDRHDLAMPGQQPDESLHIGRRDAVGKQLLGILGEGVEAVEKEELAPLPAVEDFHRRAPRMAGQVCRQQDVGVRHRAERTGHFLQPGGDVPMRLLKPGKRFVPSPARGFFW